MAENVNRISGVSPEGVEGTKIAVDQLQREAESRRQASIALAEMRMKEGLEKQRLAAEQAQAEKDAAMRKEEFEKELSFKQMDADRSHSLDQMRVQTEEVQNQRMFEEQKTQTELARTRVVMEAKAEDERRRAFEIDLVDKKYNSKIEVLNQQEETEAQAANAAAALGDETKKNEALARVDAIKAERQKMMDALGKVKMVQSLYTDPEKTDFVAKELQELNRAFVEKQNKMTEGILSHLKSTAGAGDVASIATGEGTDEEKANRILARVGDGGTVKVKTRGGYMKMNVVADPKNQMLHLVTPDGRAAVTAAEVVEYAKNRGEKPLISNPGWLSGYVGGAVLDAANVLSGGVGVGLAARGAAALVGGRDTQGNQEVNAGAGHNLAGDLMNDANPVSNSMGVSDERGLAQTNEGGLSGVPDLLDDSSLQLADAITAGVIDSAKSNDPRAFKQVRGAIAELVTGLTDGDLTTDDANRIKRVFQQNGVSMTEIKDALMLAKKANESYTKANPTDEVYARTGSEQAARLGTDGVQRIVNKALMAGERMSKKFAVDVEPHPLNKAHDMMVSIMKDPAVQERFKKDSAWRKRLGPVVSAAIMRAIESEDKAREELLKPAKEILGGVAYNNPDTLVELLGKKDENVRKEAESLMAGVSQRDASFKSGAHIAPVRKQYNQKRTSLEQERDDEIIRVLKSHGVTEEVIKSLLGRDDKKKGSGK